MKKQQLTECPLFYGLGEHEIEDALSLFSATQISYEKGAHIMTLSDKSTQFWLVLSGTVHVCCDDEEGHHMIMAVVTPFHTFGESLCYLGLHSGVYAEAQTNVTLLSLDGSILREPPHSSLQFLLQQRFTAMLARKALEMNARIQILCKRSIRDKIFAMFTHYGGQSNGRAFSLPFDRAGMAFYLGVDRSALSRELCRLEDGGYISFSKNEFYWHFH